MAREWMSIMELRDRVIVPNQGHVLISMSRYRGWRKKFLLDTLDYTSGSIPQTGTVRFKSHTGINRHPTDSSHHFCSPDAPSERRLD
jgi:hypothetical protein